MPRRDVFDYEIVLDRDQRKIDPRFVHLGRQIKRVVWSPQGQACIELDPIMCSCGWNDGGCVALSEALVCLLPGSLACGLVRRGAEHEGAGHMGAVWCGTVFDADGAHTREGWGPYFMAAEHAASTYVYRVEPSLADGLVRSRQVTRAIYEALASNSRVTEAIERARRRCVR